MQRPGAVVRRSSLVVLLFAVTGGAACTGPRPAGDRADAGGSTASAAPGSPDSPQYPQGAPPESPRTMAALHPAIQEVGEADTVPTQIAIEFTEPITADARSSVPDDTRVEISPSVQGDLAYGSQSTLLFRARQPLRPDTQYTVRLKAVKTTAGLVVPEPGATYEHTFTTPKLRFLHANLSRFDPGKHRLEVELVFTAPVQQGTVERLARWTVDGQPIERVAYERTPRANVVRATLSGPRLDYERTVEYREAAGVRSTVDAAMVAPAASDRLKLHAGKPVTIFAARPGEGANGFYVMVVCRDQGAGDSTMWYWDERTAQSYEVSPRCVLDASDAQESVHFTPPVKFEVTPTRGGFRLLGDFKRGSYSVRIDADARTVDGGTLVRPFEASFSVPARSPKLSFVSQGRYLPANAWKQLAIRHTNVSSAKLTVRNVPPENLVFWMSGEQESADPRTASIVLTRTIALKSESDVDETTWIDLATLFPRPPSGLLELEIAGEGANAKLRVMLTDLNLVAKRAASGKVEVWALDMHGNAPVPGVAVRQVVMNGRAISACTTDRDGSCVLAGRDPADPDPAEPFALIATRENDFTYLKFSDLKIDIADAAVQGRPYSSPAAYRAAAYAERGVYRPGETAHVAAIVRARDDHAPAEGMPLLLKLLDPRGKVTRKLVRKTNAAGMITADLRFADYADTGRWSVVIAAGEGEVGRLTFSVEEFVPERMKVTVESAVTGASLADQVSLTVSAAYLFGGSAEGSRVELACSLAPARFAPRKNGNFEYGVWREGKKAPSPLAIGSATGQIDARGKAELTCPPLDGRGGYGGTARLEAKAAVFEAGSGRTTEGEASVLVHPDRFYIGLATGVKTARVKEPVAIDGVVVDWDGELVAEPKMVELELFRVENEYDWAYDGEGRWNFRHYTRLASEGKLPPVLVKNGKFAATMTPGSEAEGYVLRARAGRAATDLSIAGTGYAWWSEEGPSGRDETPRPQRPATVPITAPERIRVGQKAKLLFEAPFKGRALLTLETDQVLSREWVDVPAGSNEWTVELKDFAPNVYASVFVARDPHLDSKESFMPSRGFGVVSLRVEPEALEQHVELSAPAEARPNGKLEVKLDLGKLAEPTFVTLAAVDEGILSLTRFASPDPLASLLDQRALGVTTYDTIGWDLLLPAGGPGKSSGGDGAGSAGRVQPVKPVALWSGVVEVPASGKATVSFDVPQYRGSLRVMAVSVSKTRIGHASANVLVRDPLVLETTLPRFLSFGDVAEVPVFVTNLSGKAQRVEVSLAAEPIAVAGLASPRPLSASDLILIRGSGKRTLELAAGGHGSAVFRVKPLQQVGAARLRVRAHAGDLQSFEDLEVPFLPAGPRTREIQRLELSEGKNDLARALTGWLPTTERTTIWVTSNPYGDAFQHLAYLVHYPYGCIEQTTSGTRAVLYAASLVGNIDPTLVARAKVEDMVNAGIERILSMQTASGGFAYWPGGTDPHPWGTAYATHLLLDARKQRYPVPEERIADALAWIENELVTRYENPAERRSPSWYQWDDAEPYLHFVLASAGRGRKARIERLIELERSRAKGDSERAEALYLLQAALYLAGDHRHEVALRAPDVSAVSDLRKNGWSFYSDRRRRGFELATFSDLFGRDPAGEPLANLVAESLRGHPSPWYTTQEVAWAVAGLAKRIGEVEPFGSVSLLAGGKELKGETRPGNKSSDRSWSIARASELGDLVANVSGARGKVYAILSSDGVKANAGYRTGGEGLRLKRSWVDAHGEPINLGDGSLRLGDVVYVRIAISNTTPERLSNLALVDRFPAGWEIENPRLGRGDTSFDWIDREKLWTPDDLELRDDRLEVFGWLGAQETREVVYALRAVTSGQFTVPPVEAEAMYDPNIWAREPGQRATITGPWKDQAD